LSLQERIEHVQARIEAACKRSGRKPDDVKMIAVTKYVPLETVKEVLQEGLAHIGENRWQDAQAKWEALGSRATWHFIGHLQTNKVKDVIGKFGYIHSLDRLSLAEELEKKGAQLDIRVKCFIQLNVAKETTKFGLAPEALSAFAEKIREFPHLEVIGLMTMAPHTTDTTMVRAVFSELRKIKEQLNKQAILPNQLPHLSMGMSNDYEIAIEEGATWIRLGTVLVGK
jgi:pyridoxal phosphate enzyme (YggS family)